MGRHYVSFVVAAPSNDAGGVQGTATCSRLLRFYTFDTYVADTVDGGKLAPLRAPNLL